MTTLYSFGSTPGDGASPQGGVIQGTDGNFYGTTEDGGIYGGSGVGTVFRLSVGLGPFVETIPAFGKVGEAVLVLGTNLTGTTNVNFNGAPAQFKVSSPTAIKAFVPSAAGTGLVQVVTPSGTLSSNVPFQVRP